MSVFGEFFTSMWNFGAYSRFIKNRGGKVFRYGILVNIIVLLLYGAGIYKNYVKPYNDFMEENGGIESYISSKIPYFEIIDGELYMNGNFLYDENNVYVEIDSSKDFSVDMLDNFDRETVILADHSAILIKDNNSIQVKTFSELTNNGSEIVTKDVLMEAILNITELLKKFLICAVVLIVVFSVFEYFFEALLYVLVGLIANTCVSRKIRAGGLYKIAVYAMTLPNVLVALLSIFQVKVPFMGFILTVIFIVTAVIKTSKKTEEEEQLYMELNPGTYGDGSAAFNSMYNPNNYQQNQWQNDSYQQNGEQSNSYEQNTPVKSYQQLNDELKAERENNDNTLQ